MNIKNFFMNIANSFIAIFIWIFLEILLFFIGISTGIYEIFSYENLGSVFLSILINLIPLIILYGGMFFVARKIFFLNDSLWNYISVVLVFILYGIIVNFILYEKLNVLQAYNVLIYSPVEIYFLVSTFLSGPVDTPLSDNSLKLLYFFMSLLPVFPYIIGLKLQKKNYMYE